MTVPTEIDLKTLRAKKGDYLISMYLPTSGKDAAYDRQELSRMSADLEKRLAEAGFSQEDIDKYLATLRATMNNEYFWQNLDQGLAMFISKDVARYYSVPTRFGEQVQIDDHFHLEPLEPIAAPPLGMPRIA